LKIYYSRVSSQTFQKQKVSPARYCPEVAAAKHEQYKFAQYTPEARCLVAHGTGEEELE